MRLKKQFTGKVQYDTFLLLCRARLNFPFFANACILFRRFFFFFPDLLLSVTLARLAVSELTLHLLILSFCSFSLSFSFSKRNHTFAHTESRITTRQIDHSWQCMCGHAPQNRTHHRGEPCRPLREAESRRPHPGCERMLHHQQVPL